jgi:hypothetical protein
MRWALVLLLAAPGWARDLEAARKEASAANKPMMVVFRCTP